MKKKKSIKELKRDLGLTEPRYRTIRKSRKREFTFWGTFVLEAFASPKELTKPRGRTGIKMQT